MFLSSMKTFESTYFCIVDDSGLYIVIQVMTVEFMVIVASFCSIIDTTGFIFLFT